MNYDPREYYKRMIEERRRRRMGRFGGSPMSQWGSTSLPPMNNTYQRPTVQSAPWLANGYPTGSGQQPNTQGQPPIGQPQMNNGGYPELDKIQPYQENPYSPTQGQGFNMNNMIRRKRPTWGR